MAVAFEDHVAVTELISLHGHLIDGGELDRLDELFTPDITYDLTDFGEAGTLRGLDAVRGAAIAMGEHNPVGHHVTNIVLTALDADRIGVLSKGLGVKADGGCGTVTYEDTVVRTERGWRISHRKVLARRAPLGGG